MEEKEDQNEREWQLERETGCSVKWGGCIEKLRFEQKLEKVYFRQAEIIPGRKIGHWIKHSRQKNRPLDPRYKFTWHVQRAARRPKCLEQCE